MICGIKAVLKMITSLVLFSIYCMIANINIGWLSDDAFRGYVIDGYGWNSHFDGTMWEEYPEVAYEVSFEVTKYYERVTYKNGIAVSYTNSDFTYDVTDSYSM